MAVISTPNASTIKVKFDHGLDINGDRVVKTKSFNSIKYQATNEDIMEVINAISSLQQHSVIATNRVDNSSLSE